MIVNQNILEIEFNKFVNFIQLKTGEVFSTFKESKYFINEEGYKDDIYKDARKALAYGNWKKEDIGTGKIQQKVNAAIKVTAKYKDGLLVSWQKRDAFSKMTISEELESTFGIVN